MASIAVHGLFDIQPHSSVVRPLATLPKSSAPTREAPTNIELSNLGCAKCYNGPAGRKDQIPWEQSTPGVQSPKTPNELEMSRPNSPARNETVDMVQTWSSSPMNKWRILSCCMVYLANGMSDSVVGALIPSIEESYSIGYAVVSLVFVGNAIGFITAAFFTETILGKLGRAKTLILAEAVLLSAYSILAATPPFPAVVIAFFILGCGTSSNLALNNVFCANLHPPSVILGAAHGSYGIGGVVAPIVGTLMVSNGIQWSRFYIICLGLRLCCMAGAGWSFWGYQEDHRPTLLSTTERNRDGQESPEPASSFRNLKTVLKSRVTIFGALFIFAYQGAEVAISGWVISFLINYRGGDPARVGYVTAGFWGGITLGRFILTHLAPRIGEKKFVTILVAGCLALQLLAWLVPNVIGNAVAVAFLGFLLGPVYPCAQTIFSRLIPRHVQTTAIGFIGGAGSSGGAVAPFTTGLLAQASGTWVLHPVCIGMYVVVLACWFSLPKVRKRSE